MKPLRFNLVDLERANDEWGANCGPGAIAAICGLTLDELRPHLGDFERKRYTSPTLMLDALKRLGVDFVQRVAGPGQSLIFSTYGLCRVQWEGPWCEPGVPIRVRYGYTHWIGACTSDAPAVPGSPEGPSQGGVGIFDINTGVIGEDGKPALGWCSLADWAGATVPFILKDIKRASGGWHLTHTIEVCTP